MKYLIIATMTVWLTVALASSAGASTLQGQEVQAQKVHALRKGIAWQRSMTWHFQDLAGVARTPSKRVERRVTSIPFLQWDETHWSHKRVAAKRLLAARPAHWALWNCIHNGAYPGAPHEGNSSSGTYTGPLQMTYPWDGFYVHWYSVPIATVYHYAEIGFQQHGYSTYWLEHQWPNTAPPCIRYA